MNPDFLRTIDLQRVFLDGAPACPDRLKPAAMRSNAPFVLHGSALLSLDELI
jgi:hypothetical protein